jgi:prefoldin subunit 5
MRRLQDSTGVTLALDEAAITVAERIDELEGLCNKLEEERDRLADQNNDLCDQITGLQQQLGQVAA